MKIGDEQGTEEGKETTEKRKENQKTMWNIAEKLASQLSSSFPYPPTHTPNLTFYNLVRFYAVGCTEHFSAPLLRIRKRRKDKNERKTGAGWMLKDNEQK